MELTRRGERLLIPIFAVAFGNFVAFWVIGLSLGGSAVGGKVEDGRYYLNLKGRFTEVSHAVYLYSSIHHRSWWVTHAAGFLAAGCLLLTGDWRRRRPAEPGVAPVGQPPSWPSPARTSPSSARRPPGAGWPGCAARRARRHRRRRP